MAISVDYSTNEDKYGDWMGRNKSSSDRLKFQVLLWRARFGWSLPPTVPLKEKIGWEVADVATGTGDWIMDMAAEFPDANFTGFDIAEDQFPEPDLLPDHVKFRGDFDVYRPLPAEYVSKFDVVHVRLLFVGIRANNVAPIMENLVKMLKPGGYLVWGDLNIRNHVKVDMNDPSTPERPIKLQASLLDDEHWLDSLDRTYGEFGLVDVTRHTQRLRRQLVRPWNSLVAWGSREHLEVLRRQKGDDDELVKMKTSNWTAGVSDSKKGLKVIYNPSIVVGRKPLSAVNWGSANGQEANGHGVDGHPVNGQSELPIV